MYIYIPGRKSNERREKKKQAEGEWVMPNGTGTDATKTGRISIGSTRASPSRCDWRGGEGVPIKMNRLGRRDAKKKQTRKAHRRRN